MLIQTLSGIGKILCYYSYLLTIIIPISRHLRKMGQFSTYRGVVGVLITCSSSDSRFVKPTDSSREQRSYSIFCLFLYHYCKLKTNFIANCQYYYTWGVHLRESKHKRKIQFLIFKTVSLQESVYLQEYVNTEFDWELNREFEKQCLLVELTTLTS